MIEGVSPTALETALTGAKLSAISRKGKYSCVLIIFFQSYSS